MKAEFIEILKEVRERIATSNRPIFICIELLNLAEQKALKELNTYYESALYDTLAENYFKSLTLIQILKEYVSNKFLRTNGDKKLARLMWIDYLINRLSLMEIYKEEHVLKAAQEATDLLIQEILSWE